LATPATLPQPTILDEALENSSSGTIGKAVFALMMATGVIYIAAQLRIDLSVVHDVSVFPYLLLGLALLIALGFEFVNGFHDTANAVATVIYTNSLKPHTAVVYSGILNFVGVLLSSGTVAFAIVSLLPPELILKGNRGSGFAMIFALLVAAILWNLGTWYRGLPASSSHTMIGSVLGVGVAYQLMQGNPGTTGVNWEQVKKVFAALCISPLVGFAAAALVFLLFKLLAKDPRLYQAPKGTAPPPFYIRALLILTCGGVSYAHGSNDGQKGMGLIMLILVGTVPTAYALNHAMGANQVQAFATASTRATAVLDHYVGAKAAPEDAGPELEKFISTKQYEPGVMVALRDMVFDIRDEAVSYGTLARVPQGMHANVRNQMYLTSETLQLMEKNGGPAMSAADVAVLAKYQSYLNKSTKFIPMWVKVAVALALGMGTMIGWKRIVVTVGEKIGKSRMTYAQGASAELVAMTTILAAGTYGLPVSTTHVVSSSVAGTMAANRSGLQRATVRNIGMAWVFTLPAAALLSGGLFWVFNSLAR
jgi:PiT family inorganic phosphate transporter